MCLHHPSRPQHAYRLCRECYNRQWRQDNPRETSRTVRMSKDDAEALKRLARKLDVTFAEAIRTAITWGLEHAEETQSRPAQSDRR